jgi:hypothetical protein
MDTYLADIKAKNAAGANIIGAFVVYDLPNRDCAALASNGEYTVANDGLTKYKAYIDAIAAILKKYPETPVSLVIGKQAWDLPSKPYPLLPKLTKFLPNNRTRQSRQPSHKPQRRQMPRSPNLLHLRRRIRRENSQLRQRSLLHRRRPRRLARLGRKPRARRQTLRADLVRCRQTEIPPWPRY